MAPASNSRVDTVLVVDFFMKWDWNEINKKEEKGIISDIGNKQKLTRGKIIELKTEKKIK